MWASHTRPRLSHRVQIPTDWVTRDSSKRTRHFPPPRPGPAHAYKKAPPGPRTARAPLPPLRHSAQVQNTTSRPVHQGAPSTSDRIAPHSHTPPRHPQIRSPRQPWPGTSSSRAGTANPASASPASGAAPPRRGATSSSSGASPSASSPTASPPTPPATTPPSSPPIPSRTPCVLRLPRSSLPFFLLRRRRSGFSAHDSALLRSARFMSRRRSARKWCPWRNSR